MAQTPIEFDRALGVRRSFWQKRIKAPNPNATACLL
jgi:hypothetical protein